MNTQQEQRIDNGKCPFCDEGTIQDIVLDGIQPVIGNNIRLIFYCGHEVTAYETSGGATYNN
jgi:hypothetical protein